MKQCIGWIKLEIHAINWKATSNKTIFLLLPVILQQISDIKYSTLAERSYANAGKTW